ncbi:glycosyltransferase family 2 protein [Paenibacillus sp. y28]|uniref:glycosyltransferase family 2 protein n=1 Tax=Paenibacillus sp. y28 TaxID=3129110 RepID=UPI003019FEE8
MIVRNEERHIARCLKSVQDVVDEMIIVDTGSTDRTVDICHSFGASVVFYRWEDDFAAARNAGIEKAAGEWILWLDADEEVEPEDRWTLREALLMPEHRLLSVDTIHYYGETLDPGLTYSLRQIRLFRRGCGFQFEGAAHETLNVAKILTPEEQADQSQFLPVKLYHYGYMKSAAQEPGKRERNLRFLKQELERGNPQPWIYYHK